MIQECFETILVTVNTASGIFKITHKPKSEHFKCVGVDFNVTGTHASQAICRVGLTFNNQKGDIINEYIFNKNNTTTEEKNRFQELNQHIEKNNLITGYVQDLAVAAPTYYVRIILKMLKDE